MQVKEAIKYCTIDSGIALAVAFIINLAVVGTFAVQVMPHSTHTCLYQCIHAQCKLLLAEMLQYACTAHIMHSLLLLLLM